MLFRRVSLRLIDWSVFLIAAVMKLWHVVDGIFMSVLFYRASWGTGSTSLLSRDSPLLAGSSSLPLTMSGMCCEGITPTDGRYGFVAFFSSFVTVHLQPRIEVYLL